MARRCSYAETRWTLVLKKRNRKGDRIFSVYRPGRILLFDTKREALDEAQEDEEPARVMIEFTLQ